MKRKQRIKMALLLVVVSIAIIGIIGGNRMNEPTEKEKQIAFLKKHEEEMKNYIKSQDNKISKVIFDWNSTEQETVGNGLPQGAGEILSLRISIFDKNATKINSFGFAVQPDSISNPTSIKEMYTINADYNYVKGDILYKKSRENSKQ